MIGEYDPYKVQHKQKRSKYIDGRGPACGFAPEWDSNRPNYSKPFFQHDQWIMVTCPACLKLGGALAQRQIRIAKAKLEAKAAK